MAASPSHCLNDPVTTTSAWGRLFHPKLDSSYKAWAVGISSCVTFLALPRGFVTFGARKMCTIVIQFSIPTEHRGTSTGDASTLCSRGRRRTPEHTYSLVHRGLLVPKANRAIGRSARSLAVSSLSFTQNYWLTQLGVHPCLLAREVPGESSTII